MDHAPETESRSSRITLVGSGRLARTLARSFARRIVSVVTRNFSRGEKIVELAGTGRVVDRDDRLPIDQGECLWIVVADREIEAVAHSLSARRDDWTGITVVHSSGALPVSVLDPFVHRGAFALALHPNGSFTGDEPVPPGLVWSVSSHQPDAERRAAGILDGLAPRLVHIPDQNRPLYHAAASVAANYSIALFVLATELYRRAGIPESMAVEIVEQFMRRAVERVANGDAASAITGPVARGDFDVVQAQLDAVGRDAGEFLDSFVALGALTAELFSKGGIDEWRTIFELYRGGQRSDSSSSSADSSSLSV